MAEEEEKSKGFKVQDRRRFSAEGESRPETDNPEPPTSARPNQQAQASGPESPTGFTTSPTPDAPETEINFATFLVGLSTEALAALGEIADPATGAPRRDLRAAQQLIDIIGILRDKTRGNLERDEENLLEAILFDLRMKYVELAKQSAR